MPETHMTGLLQMFYAPGAVFDDIREGRRGWAPPFFAVLLLNLIVSAAVINMIGYEHVVRRGIEGNKAVAERLGPAKVEEAVQTSLTPARRVITYVTPVIGLAIVLPIVAGILTGLLALLENRPSFGKTLAMYCYTFWAYLAVSGILSVLVLMLMADKSEADPQHLLMFNLGALLDKDTTNRFVYSLASSFDLLAFGWLALIALGFSRIAPGVTFGKAVAAVGGLWTVWILIKAGFALALGGLFG